MGGDRVIVCGCSILACKDNRCSGGGCASKVVMGWLHGHENGTMPLNCMAEVVVVVKSMLCLFTAVGKKRVNVAQW